MCILVIIDEKSSLTTIFAKSINNQSQKDKLVIEIQWNMRCFSLKLFVNQIDMMYEDAKWLSMSLFSSRLFVQIFFLSQVPGCSLCQSWPCQGRRWVGSQQQMLTWETMPSWSTPSWTESQGTPLTSPEPTKRPWSFWTRWEECPQDIWESEKTLLKSPS